MLEKFENYFFGFFDKIDQCWKYLSIDLLKTFEFQYKDSVINHMKFLEEKFKIYNPISIFIGTLIMFMMIFYLMKFFKKTWKKISKYLNKFCYLYSFS